MKRVLRYRKDWQVAMQPGPRLFVEYPPDGFNTVRRWMESDGVDAACSIIDLKFSLSA
jgi:hypothetical protein